MSLGLTLVQSRRCSARATCAQPAMSLPRLEVRKENPGISGAADARMLATTQRSGLCTRVPTGLERRTSCLSAPSPFPLVHRDWSRADQHRRMPAASVDHARGERRLHSHRRKRDIEYAAGGKSCPTRRGLLRCSWIDDRASHLLRANSRSVEACAGVGRQSRNNSPATHSVPD
jgi:hypothetical protein